MFSLRQPALIFFNVQHLRAHLPSHQSVALCSSHQSVLYSVPSRITKGTLGTKVCWNDLMKKWIPTQVRIWRNRNVLRVSRVEGCRSLLTVQIHRQNFIRDTRFRPPIRFRFFVDLGAPLPAQALVEGQGKKLIVSDFFHSYFRAPWVPPRVDSADPGRVSQPALSSGLKKKPYSFLILSTLQGVGVGLLVVMAALPQFWTRAGVPNLASMLPGIFAPTHTLAFVFFSQLNFVLHKRNHPMYEILPWSRDEVTKPHLAGLDTNSIHWFGSVKTSI